MRTAQAVLPIADHCSTGPGYPHPWYTPKPTDDHLQCSNCGQRVDFEWPPDFRTNSIFKAVQKRRPQDTKAFADYFTTLPPVRHEPFEGDPFEGLC